MQEFFNEIRSYFNLAYDEPQASLSLTLINPNISLQTITQLYTHLIYVEHIRILEITIIECINFDDELLKELAKAIPQAVQSLSLDFTGCESLRGEGFLDLFEKLDGMPLTKLSLELGSVYDINDIVVQGLTLLLSNQPNLKELYLDFYQNEKITEDGYLLLAEAVSGLQQLTALHIDLSANYNLTEDALEILFEGLAAGLKSFGFKILDTEGIAGGSFFKLGESLGQMTELSKLQLTVSTFSNLNQKGVYSILKGISKLKNLATLSLNLSDIDLPQKMLSYLTIGPKLSNLNLDLSCNKRITFADLLNLGPKLKRLRKISINLDFCLNVTQDAIAEVVEMVAEQQICTQLLLPDRNYSAQFQSEVAASLLQMRSLVNLQLETKSEGRELKKLREFVGLKQRFLCVCKQSIKRGVPRQLSKMILELCFDL